MAAPKSGSYFQFFNDIEYSNTSAIDITERVIINNNKNIISNPYLYYPVDIKEGFRADNIAQNAYQNPFYSWIIYLSNEVIDPYYDWYLTNDQFNQFIVKKYGSYQAAETKVAYFINNWADQPDIDVSVYNALDPDMKKYWEPNYNQSAVYSYSRIQEDWSTTTNFIVKLNLQGQYIYKFDEIIHISYGDIISSDGKYIPNSNGQAQVLAQSVNTIANTTTLMVQHVFLTNNDITPADANNIIQLGYVYGNESQSNGIIINGSYVSNNISAASAAYWTPIYYYDMEVERNESKKTIYVLKNDYAPSFVNTTKALLANVGF